MVDLTYALEFTGGAIVSILVISNPISTSAVFITLTQGMSREEKSTIVRRSVRYSLAILLVFAFTGFLIFQVFGFGVGAFRIAGGVLLFSTAAGMLNPRPTSEAASEMSRDMALIPLSIPFTAGPGTIVTVVVLMSEAQGAVNSDPITAVVAMMGVVIGILITIAVTYLMLMRSDRVEAVLREGGRRVVTRLMGLLVMAIAIQFIINGIKDVLPQLTEGLGGPAGLVSLLLGGVA